MAIVAHYFGLLRELDAVTPPSIIKEPRLVTYPSQGSRSDKRLLYRVTESFVSILKPGWVLPCNKLLEPPSEKKDGNRKKVLVYKLSRIEDPDALDDWSLFDALYGFLAGVRLCRLSSRNVQLALETPNQQPETQLLAARLMP